MAKKLELTNRIRELIAKATDNAVDPESVSVYEAITINTKPVTKNNVFSGAVHTGGTLREMALACASTHVPLHTMHAQDVELPVGKVFYGEVIPTGDGHEELRSMFFLPNTEKVLIDKLEGGAIEEVSIAARYKHLNCSDCGWDYMGEDATIINLYDRVCANEHQIGKNGVHLKLNGLDKWMETSLVPIGAANGAKIVSRTKALLGQEQYNALAASGRSPELTTLYASQPLPENDDMDLTQLMESVKTLTASETTAKIALTAANEQIATLKLTAEKVAPLEAQVAELTSKLTAAQAVDGVKAQAELAAAMSFVRKEADRLCIAAGEAALADTATLADLQASIEKNRLKLADTFPVNGVTTQVLTTRKPASSSFKTARN